MCCARLSPALLLIRPRCFRGCTLHMRCCVFRRRRLRLLYRCGGCAYIANSGVAIWLLFGIALSLFSALPASLTALDSQIYANVSACVLFHPAACFVSLFPPHVLN